MGSFLTIFNFLVNIAFWIIILQAILSWLVAFQVVNLQQPLIRQIWSTLNQITEPVYRPFRRLMPDMGGMDFTPMIVLILLYFAQIIVCNNLGPHPSCF
ncbi:YggT family protein [Rhodobacteraceae bacterium NNCM2]|nr:YggT family protein [Coraliihabitans acroporae]